MAVNPKVRGLFLSGSFGRGTADHYSDLDFICIAAEDDHAGLVAVWRAALCDIGPPVLWRQNQVRGYLINAITPEWLRIDLSVAGESGLSGRAQSLVKPLIDRDDLFASLPQNLPDRAPRNNRIDYIVSEYFRVIGLTAVVLNRKEWVTGVWGAGILRDLYRDLLLEHCPEPDPGGALHLSRLLSRDDYQTLSNLPYPGADLDELLDAFRKISTVFLPYARSVMETRGMEWPEKFEQATRQYLVRELGVDLL